LDNQQYIAGLLNNDHAILREIYENYADRIKHHIIKNGGTANDAKDVFQDALMIIYKKAQADDFELTSQFYTYLFGICRFVFDKKRKKNARNSVTNTDFDGYIDESNFEEDLFEREKQKIYQEHFEKMGEFCQQLLELFFVKTNMEEIAIKLNLQNAHTARNRKYRCQKELEKMIQADKRYLELLKK
jgi:RNA polymerase sigma factor (sigma-70 family)